MMRRINLLPAHYALRQRRRRNMGLVAGLGIALLLALVGWRFSLSAQVAGAEEELAAAQSHNGGLQNRITKLQQFDDLQVEVQAKASDLLTVFAGDVAWPSVLNDVALVTPGDVWLTNLSASAGMTEGAAPVGTETATVQLTPGEAFGRIQFQGKSLSMPGVAKWLIRLRSAEEFDAAWLNDATKEEGANGEEVVTFDSTIELNPKASSLLRELEELAGVGGKAVKP
jgi:Tfp pilus assembly protein PilN